ncbi:MAG: rod shape-determining protein MreC [Bdellovibrionota bacterium]
MWNIIKEYRHYLATLVLVVVPVIALNAGGKSPADFHWFDRAAVSVSAPVQSAIRWSIETSWDALQSYVMLLSTQNNNRSLALENRRLLNEIAAFQEVARENDRLRHLVDFNAPLEGRKIVAQVIAQDVNPQFRMIRLNKGTKQGVEVGMAVIALEGVVGRVIRAGNDFSDVLSLLDSSSAIDALVQRNRYRGVVEGQGGSTLSMKYLRRTDDVQEGDLIIASGIGGLFPKGLTIGKVTSVKKKNFGISQTVEVAPAADFNRLEEVTVIDPPKVPLEDATLEDVQDRSPGKHSKKDEKHGEKHPAKPGDEKAPKAPDSAAGRAGLAKTAPTASAPAAAAPPPAHPPGAQ